MKTKFIIIILALVCLIQPKLYSEEVEEYIPLTLNEIPDFSSKAEIRVYELERLINDTVQLEEWKKGIEVIKSNIEQLKDKNDTVKYEYDLSELDKYLRNLNLLQTELDNISKPLSKQIETYTGYYNEMNSKYQISLETRLAFKYTNLAPAISDELNNSKNSLRTLRNKIKEEQQHYLNLKSETNSLQEFITLENDKVNALRNDIVKNLIVPEQLGLFELIKKQKEDTSFVKVSSVYSINKSEYAEAWHQDKLKFILLLLLFVLFSIIIIISRRSLKKHEVYKRDRDNKVLFLIGKRPIITSIILSAFFFSVLTDLSPEMHTLFLLAILVPILIIFRVLFRNIPVVSVVLFSVYYLISRSWLFINLSTVSSRLYVIGVALFTISIVVFTYKYINKEAFFKKWRVALKTLLVIIFVLAFAVIPLNINGNVRLANILIKGVINISILSIILLFIYRILIAFIKVLFLNEKFRKSNIIKHRGSRIMKSIRRLIGFVFIFHWLYSSLSIFGVKNEVVDKISYILNYEIVLGHTSFALNGIVAFVISLWVSILISRLLKMILEEEIFPRNQTRRGSSGTIILLVRYSIITIGFFVALASMGIGFDKMTIIIGSLGVGIGFGLQSVFNNLVSGIILAVERPISIGDTIEVGQLTGIVKEIGFRSSRVRTYDGAEVVVPNGDIVSNQMINWTLSDRKRRLSIDFGVALDSNPEKVLEILKEITDGNPNIVKNPGPSHRFMGFGESTLNFQLLFWIADYETGFGIGTETMLMLFNKLKISGIKIPHPQRDIHLYTINENGEKEKVEG